MGRVRSDRTRPVFTPTPNAVQFFLRNITTLMVLAVEHRTYLLVGKNTL
jgi:hypothetical protein